MTAHNYKALLYNIQLCGENLVAVIFVDLRCAVLLTVMAHAPEVGIFLKSCFKN